MRDKSEYPQALRARLTSAGNRLRATWEAEAIPQRRETELRWLKDLRQYKGVYDPDVLARMDPNQSRLFVKLTRKKVRTVDARLRDMLFPASKDKNWSIQPTPRPRLSPADEQRVQMLAQQASAQGQHVTHEQIDALRRKLAKRAAEAMATRMSDQLIEARYNEVVGNDVIHSADLYGTGILKGPLVDIEHRLRWEAGERGWMVAEEEVVKPHIEHVALWDIYPDMSARTFRDVRYVYQRYVMPRHEVLALAGRSDFDGQTIRDYTTAHKAGDAQDRYHDQELRLMGERAEVADARDGRFELLEYWGTLDAEDLAECGCEVERDAPLLWANIWLLGPFVIKAVLSPIEGMSHPYHAFYCDHDETSIFAEGFAALMRDDQVMLNSGVRAMLDNAAVVSGPILEVNLSMLAPGEDPTSIYPRRVFVRETDPQESNAPAVREIPISAHIQEYLALIGTAERWAHEHTVPAYMGGTPTSTGAADTASGQSMLMAAANVDLKDLARNFDWGISVPFITALYNWNMAFTDDESLKGDYEIKARGASSLVAKEFRAAQLDQFAAMTANQLDAPWIKRDELLRRRLEAHDLDEDLMLTGDEHAEAMKSQGPDPDMLKLELERMRIEIDRIKAVAETGKVMADTKKIRAETLTEQVDAAVKAGSAAAAMMIDQQIPVEDDQGTSNPGAAGPVGGSGGVMRGAGGAGQG